MNYISSTTTVAYIDTGQAKTVYLPSTFNIEGKILTVKDKNGFGYSSNITIRTIGGDLFEGNSSNFIISKNYGYATFIAKQGRWLSLTGISESQTDLGITVSSLSSPDFISDPVAFFLIDIFLFLIISLVSFSTGFNILLNDNPLSSGSTGSIFTIFLLSLLGGILKLV